MPDGGFINQGPMPPTVTATGALAPEQQNSPLSGQLQAPQQSPVPALQPPTPDPAALKHVGRLASIGHVFNTLAGSANDYQVDPKTGQTVATPIKQKPGQMFRNMLAGALMGGAAGAGNDFATGLVKGGAAGVQDQRNQDLQRRAQAQEQFKNQVTAQDQQMKQAEFADRQKLNQAQLAHFNLEMVGLNQQLSHQSFKMHQEVGDWGNELATAMRQGGLKPLTGLENIPEAEMEQKFKNGFGNAMWLPTGTRPSIDKNGNAQWEQTFTAFNPTDKVPITQGILNAWKTAGLDKKRPDLFERKPGYEVTPGEFSALSQLAAISKKEKLGADQEEAQTANYKAEAEKNLAEAARYRQERTNMINDNKKSDLMGKALKEFSDAKGDWSKVSAGARLELANSSKDFLNAAVRQYNEADKNFDDAGKASAKENLDFWNDIGKSAYGYQQNNALPQGGGKPLTDVNVAARFLKEAGGDRAKAQELAKQSGWLVSGTTPNPEDLQQVVMVLPNGTRITTTPDSVGKQMKSTKAKVAPESQAAYDAWYNAQGGSPEASLE
jgi:hypothetical protein